MTRREIVQRAVHFQNPPRIPRFWYSGHEEDSDVLLVHIRKWYEGPGKNEAELGFKWQKASGDKMTMGIPAAYPLENWADFDHYVKNIMPDAYAPDRFSIADAMDFGDHYTIADQYLSGFTSMWMVRGFHALLTDMYEAPERVEALADLIFDYESDIVRQCRAKGFDCVAFYDDWGMQSTMMISAPMWREFFKERYRRQFKLCHDEGLDVFFHTCGYALPIIQDLIDVGVDIINLGQINVNGADGLSGIETVGRRFHDQVCFCQPIDYQSTGLHGTKEEIYAEARALIDHLSDARGGLIAHMQDYEASGYVDAVPGNTMLTRNSFAEQDPYKASV